MASFVVLSIFDIENAFRTKQEVVSRFERPSFYKMLVKCTNPYPIISFTSP